MAIEGSSEQTREPRIRLGMVGGGAGAFIGAVHRIAARIDDQFDLVAGALSSSPEKAVASGRDLGLDPSRTYSSYRDMAIREAKLKNGIEAVSIVTPNHVHYDAAKEFLRRGIHVICDKPLTSNLADAKKLKKVADESGALFILTHNYTGYPMIRQAREMIENGELGDIRIVQTEYPQDWLTENIEQSGQKQAAWRTDPSQSGAGGSTGDIGTHAYNLASFVTGLELDSLAADLDSFVEGRRLDDNGHVLLRFKAKGKERPAKGMLWCSQVAPGHENGLKLRVYGTKGGIEWTQADPNYLWYTPFGDQKRLITRNGAGSGAAAARISRIPSGHPEGYLEAFATIYTEAARAINARKKGVAIDPAVVYPTVDDGVKGVAFVEACVASSKRNGAWVKL
ncbi:Gfo/Idh/MocA family oxidoreductase [Rhizobium sp. P40RR-XXII]|uniref:Gfo/Idh/MocA family protein n=1 Tax=unclassified Rhizobium TaxID=2613769 RepID=UPI0014572209|nr:MULTISPECIES: Gfo/Idh/MocA family oxidoreductase [unclassified Rhizobium]NLR84298.1 Gfo/Idh/MocA family oxidoreductase [Rhizobium sp. P28RR-XV]NLS15056.1 Gfo/Idh/MocA family oxidoreductase [Rhizobium sp. P40RR-XXII]